MTGPQAPQAHGAITSDMPRIPLLAVEDMSPEQISFYQKVVLGRRGRMVGPLLAAIHSPQLAPLWSEFGEYLRYRTVVPPRLGELAIIVAARRWCSQVEWWVHARAAAEAGVPAPVIEAIRACDPPSFDDEADSCVYEFTRSLQVQGQVEDGVYRAATSILGTQGVVELTAIIGYYTMVAMTLNAHRIPVPEEHQPLPETGSLATLPPAKAR